LLPPDDHDNFLGTKDEKKKKFLIRKFMMNDKEWTPIRWLNGKD